jgi:hypothetical protein
MPIDKKKTYDNWRNVKYSYWKKLTPELVNAFDFLFDKLDEAKEISSADEYGFFLGNIAWETRWTGEPIREGNCKTDEGSIRAVTSLKTRRIIRVNYAIPEANGNSYFGRGYCQLTWGDNYKKVGKEIDEPLYDNPSLALQREIAWKIIYTGCLKGLFTNGKHKLKDYIIEGKEPKFYEARQIINGFDQAEIVSELCKIFSKIIVFEEAA